MLHTLHAKEQGAKIIVVDPAVHGTAAKADYFYRIRSGPTSRSSTACASHFRERLGDKE